MGQILGTTSLSGPCPGLDLVVWGLRGFFPQVGLQPDKILECPTKGKDILWVIKTFTWMVGALLLRLGGEVRTQFTTDSELSPTAPHRSTTTTPHAPQACGALPQAWTARVQEHARCGLSASLAGARAEPVCSGIFGALLLLTSLSRLETHLVPA